MGKLLPGSQPPGKLPQAGLLGQVLIPRLAEQLPGFPAGQITVQPGRAEEVEQRLALIQPQGKRLPVFRSARVGAPCRMT